MCKQAAGAAHASLDFIQHQQCIVLITQRAYRLQVAGRGRNDAAFALYRLQHDGGDIAAGHRCF